MASSPQWFSRARKAIGRNEMLVHVLHLMTGTATAQLVVLALTPILSRIYTPADYGLFAVYSSIVALVSAVATLRYDMAIMLPKDDDTARTLKSTVTWIAFLTGVLASLVCLVAAPQLASLMNAPAVGPWLVLVGLSTFTLGEISALVYWLNRHSRYKQISTNRVLQSGATAVVQILLGLTRALGVGGLILGTIVGQIVSIVGLRRKTPDLAPSTAPTVHERLSVMNRYRRMPLLNAPTALIDAVRINGINLLIGFYSIASLGQFSMAWRMVEVPAALISSALAQVFFQKLSVVSPGHMYDAAKKSVVRSAAFGAVPFVLVYVLAPWVFPVFFGSNWDLAGPYAQALVPWLFMNLVTSPISTIFVITEKQHVLLLFSAVFMVVPLAIIVTMNANMLQAVFTMGLAMAAMLLIFVALAFRVARRYDSVPNHGPVMSETEP
ncbi:oligosaccharide flippase family protein [Specibacter cremeus]|uniref:oligosaccharide flippase family protein n=1 Tax=Specibacter cremeus TaxID=1629051 RepID=UPI000F7A2D7A|nr:oligosaccharide flippase family protein [Specibacter cremeus]